MWQNFTRFFSSNQKIIPELGHDLLPKYYFNLLFINHQNIWKIINISVRVTQTQEQGVHECINLCNTGDTFSNTNKPTINLQPENHYRSSSKHMNCRQTYLETQLVPRSEQLSSQLLKKNQLCCKWHKTLFVLKYIKNT
jgi:hypothetical protein